MTAVGVQEREVIAGVPTLVATIDRVVVDAADTYTLWTTFDDPVARRTYAFRPGQISMVGVFGIGEIPISVASDPARPGRLAHTIRACGRVTNVVATLRAGDRITLRGPFGRPWPVETARGGDLVIVAGGLGLAPLRSAVYEALRHRASYRRVIVLVGGRDPSQVLYRRQLEKWLAIQLDGVEVHLTVDDADAGWPHREGVVTALVPEADIDVRASTVFTCGPEVMMVAVCRAFERIGVPRERLWVTLERNMQCGVKLCGHCQLGPWFVCADGPIFRWDEIGEVLGVREL
ncbi:MAG TPA: FAD/NAD(P)-binding protein [Actinomycetota bacterium]|nr:FAD/NAD(P)-binding protein [Actinomycetota bacterium]